MTSNHLQTSFLMELKDNNQFNSESLIDKKLLNRQELFSNENSISTIKNEAISFDLSLGNNEREKLFKSKRLKQKIKIENRESIINKLSIPKDFYDQCNAMEVNINHLGELITKIKTENNIQYQYEGLVGIRKLLCSSITPPVQEIVDYGLIPYFLSLLEHPYPEFQYETLWCIINLGTDQEKSLIDLGGIAKIIKILDTSIEELLNQALWAIGNIACNSANACHEIIELKGYDKIISILSTSNNNTVIKQCTFAIVQFFRCKVNYPFYFFLKALPFIIKGIIEFHTDVDYLTDALFFILNLSELYKKSLSIILESGLIPILFDILK